MDKKTYIQISIFILISLIIAYVYLDYFKTPEQKTLKITDDSSADKILRSSDDLISDMSYFSDFSVHLIER